MRTSNGKIGAAKLNAVVLAYNEYIKALVGEIGPERAIANAPNGHKAVRGLLGQSIQIANPFIESETLMAVHLRYTDEA